MKMLLVVIFWILSSNDSEVLQKLVISAWEYIQLNSKVEKYEWIDIETTESALIIKIKQNEQNN